MPDSTIVSTRYQRIGEAFDTVKAKIVREVAAGNANFQLVQNFVASLSLANETKVDIAMSQPFADLFRRDADRANRRALILVLIAKAEAETPSLDDNIIRACDAVRTFTNVEIQNRLAIELSNISVKQSINAADARSPEWYVPGWEGTKRRPLLAGSAIGRRGSIGPGTLGCFVFIGGRTNVFILSNAHVLLQGGSNDKEIIQPPHVCGGSFFDVIADLQGPRFVAQDLDAAIAKVRPGIVCINKTPSGREITGHTPAVANMPAIKYGVATRQRFCKVTLINAPDVSTTNATLKEQMIADVQPIDIQPWALEVPGDSGCVLVDTAGNVVGLAHGQGGLPLGPGLGMANPKEQLQATHIGPILQRFNAQILVGQVTAG